MAPNSAGSPVCEANGRQFVAFYGSSVERPAEGNIAWGGDEGSQGNYVFALPRKP
jgi:hypothetical protein